MQNSDEKKQLEIYKSKELQESLNKPPKDPSGVSLEDQKFLNMIISMINKKEINLHVPSSIITQRVYDELPDQQKANIELKSQSILASLRQIKDLFDMGSETSFQIQNLVQNLRYTIESLEENEGDIFII